MNKLRVVTDPPVSGTGARSVFRQVDENSIRKLVVIFYSSVRQDSMLGPLIECSMGRRETDWEDHFRVLVSFWSSILLASGHYDGNPLVARLAIPDLVPAMLERWLTIFDLTCSKVFEPHVAIDLADRGERMARTLNATATRRCRCS